MIVFGAGLNFLQGVIDVVGRDMIEFMRKFVKTIAC